MQRFPDYFRCLVYTDHLAIPSCKWFRSIVVEHPIAFRTAKSLHRLVGSNHVLYSTSTFQTSRACMDEVCFITYQ